MRYCYGDAGRPVSVTDCPRLSDFIDFISVKRGRPSSTVINSCSRRRIPLSQLGTSHRLGAMLTALSAKVGDRYRINLRIGESANLQINATQHQWQFYQCRIFLRQNVHCLKRVLLKLSFLARIAARSCGLFLAAS